MPLEDVAVLHPVESVVFDAGAFQTLVQSFEAAHAVCRADDIFEEFIVCLSALETAWMAGEFERLAAKARAIEDLSDTLGLALCADLARRVRSLIVTGNDLALAAMVARAVRVGEASLVSVMELAYRRI